MTDNAIREILLARVKGTGLEKDPHFRKYMEEVAIPQFRQVCDKTSSQALTEGLTVEEEGKLILQMLNKPNKPTNRSIRRK